MVHADASIFAEGVTKAEAYQQVLDQVEGLFFEQRNWVCNLSNAASLLWHAYKSLPSPSNQVNWAGFYTHDPLSPTHQSTTPTQTQTQKPQLILGPFQGKVACQTIAYGRGVCGAAAASQETQLVRDVHTFPGHIACDGASLSEIVVPIVVPFASSSSSSGQNNKESGSEAGEGTEEKKGRVVAIIDVDCAEVGGFDEVDREWLEKLAKVIGEACDWP
ncbi:GAF domain-like protein [Chaetomium sp. MPI-SDFR-AT-0129]|nr:GAF domain-like protein [Chaetomium sp. MPI-SDFR-AT-0129]